MKKTLLTLCALAVSALALAQTPLPNDPAVRVGKLDNGLTYYIRHNDLPAQRADFYLATNVGAIQENPAQDGLAHFLEHMCFNGLKNLPGKTMLEYLQSIGASFGGNINASTGVETTQYMLNNIPIVREGVIDTCLLVMHDYSHFVTLDPKEIDAERGVILEEKRTRNDAGWRVQEKSGKYYYGDTKYATTTIIGTEENLKTFAPETLADFYHTWYRPDNQAVIVVGDVDVDSIEAKLKALFADIPAPVDPKAKDVILIPDNAEPMVGVITDPELTGNQITMLWRRGAIPEQFNNTDQRYMLDIVDELFTSVMSERFRDITFQSDAPFKSAMLGNGRLCESCDALFGRISYKNGDDERAFKAFLTEIERLKRYGITEPELQRAKDRLLASLEKDVQGADSRKNPEFIRPLISNFFDNTPYMEPATEYQLASAICGQLNAMIINQIVPQYISDGNISVILSGPSQVEHPSEEALTGLIYASRTEQIEAPKVEESSAELLNSAALKGSAVKKTISGVAGSTEWILKNGVKVVVLPTEYKKDEVRIKLELRGGEDLLSDDELYSFEDNIWTLYNMNTGVAGFSSTELKKMLSGKVASVQPWVNSHFRGISAQSTPKDLETALQLLYLQFTEPRFDQAEYDKGIDQLKAILPNMSNNPDFQLQSRLPKAIYGDNPRCFSISEEVLEKASLQSLERSYRKLFKDVAGATVTIVGNVSLETLKPLVEKYIGSLPKGKKATNFCDDGIRIRKGAFEDRFDFAMTTPKVTVLQVYSADLPANVENEVLMKAASYILNMAYTDTLREQEGGTYGASVSGSISYRPVEQALIQVYFDTNVEQASSLEAIAKKTITDIAQNGPSDEYFLRTAEYFKNSLQQQRISNSYWEGILDYYILHGIDKDAAREAAINSLSKESISAYLKSVLDQGNLIELVMSPEL